MDLNVFYQLKNKKLPWLDYVFYFSCTALVAVGFCYFVFFFRVNGIRQKIGDLEAKIAANNFSQQAMQEEIVLDYKKRVDDFTVIFNKHRISSRVFSFLEENTLDNVWFSSIDISQVRSEISLLGEAEDMATVSKQIKLFEQNKEYIKDIGVSDFRSSQEGIKFALKLSLDPKMFVYWQTPAATVNQSQGIPAATKPKAGEDI